MSATKPEPKAAYVINFHLTPMGAPAGTTSASCRVGDCSYETRAFRDGVESEADAKAAVIKHIGSLHGRRRFKTVAVAS